MCTKIVTLCMFSILIFFLIRPLFCIRYMGNALFSYDRYMVNLPSLNRRSSVYLILFLIFLSGVLHNEWIFTNPLRPPFRGRYYYYYYYYYYYCYLAGWTVQVFGARDFFLQNFKTSPGNHPTPLQ